MLSILCRQYHACWCSGAFRSYGIIRHGIEAMKHMCVHYVSNYSQRKYLSVVRHFPITNTMHVVCCKTEKWFIYLDDGALWNILGTWISHHLSFFVPGIDLFFLKSTWLSSICFLKAGKIWKNKGRWNIIQQDKGERTQKNVLFYYSELYQNEPNNPGLSKLKITIQVLHDLKAHLMFFENCLSYEFKEMIKFRCWN